MAYPLAPPMSAALEAIPSLPFSYAPLDKTPW